MKFLTVRVFSLFIVLAALLAPNPAGAIDGTEPVSTVSGSGGQGSGVDQLSEPIGVTVGPDGFLYVADAFNHRVQRIDADGNGTTVAGAGGSGSDANQLSFPGGVAFGSDGSLYVADAGNHRVQRIDGDGNGITVAGSGGQGSGANQLDSAFGLAFGSDGSLYVADTGNHRVQRIDGDGNGTTVAGGNGYGAGANQLALPHGLAFGSDGSVYVADRFNHRVQLIDADGNGTTVAGGNGAGGGGSQLDDPYGLAIGPDGSLYIADTSNRRVQKLTAFDTTDPVATITSPASGATITNGSTAIVEFSCTDEGTSGLDACTATLNGSSITTGAAIDTTTPGANTLVVTATDGASNSNIATIAFNIAEPAPEYGPRELTGQWAATSGAQGSIARLYMAVFNRQPDASGHAYWANRANTGLSMRDMAGYFINSPEFEATYDELSDAEFVDLLYANVMVRVGDPTGVAFWNEQLADGTPRSVVVLQFSESPEFRALTGTN